MNFIDAYFKILIEVLLDARRFSPIAVPLPNLISIKDTPEDFLRNIAQSLFPELHQSVFIGNKRLCSTGRKPLGGSCSRTNRSDPKTICHLLVIKTSRVPAAFIDDEDADVLAVLMIANREELSDNQIFLLLKNGCFWPADLHPISLKLEQAATHALSNQGLVRVI